MIKKFVTAITIMLTTCVLYAAEYHVSPSGLDANKGSQSTPFKTISAAAQIAHPGDTIIVHEGIYRERINPPRGGASADKRIVYQAAPGETVVIKGSEAVKGWERVADATWKVTISNRLFGDFNPYRELIGGDWFNRKGRDTHPGAVYLNGHWLTEATKREDVVNPAGENPLWFSKVDDQNTTIWAQFKGVDPNREDVEINVRQSVFYPEKPGVNYITVRGFTLEHAATPWAPPTAEQIGLIGTHWSKGWIIEDNVIRYSACVGVTLGKYGDKWDNLAPGAAGYVGTINRALANGWSKENIGHHIVRNNRIYHCEQAGIVGSMGAVFSTIDGNEIHDIHVRRLFSGCEQAGIKFHAPIDTVISNNHIYRTNRGIWLDWMTQGARVTRNLLHDNATDTIEWSRNWEANSPGGEQDMFVEVNHGPFLVDNNIFLSPYSVNNRSQGAVFAHNIFAGAFRIVPHDGRQTPLHEPHSTKVVKLHDNPCGDNHYYNNVFIGRCDLSGYDAARLPVYMVGNMYFNGAKPSKHEVKPLVQPGFDPGLKLVDKPDGMYLRMKLDATWAFHTGPLVTSEMLGKAIIPDVPYVQPDGTSYRLDTDYFGKKRNSQNPSPGPFANQRGKTIHLKVWPKK